MSIWLLVVARQAALNNTGHPLRNAYDEMEAARRGYDVRRQLEPEAKPAARRRWPERKRFAAAEREYTKILETIRYGGSAL